MYTTALLTRGPWERLDELVKNIDIKLEEVEKVNQESVAKIKLWRMNKKQLPQTSLNVLNAINNLRQRKL